MTELLNALVFGYRLVGYEYFMETMQEYEVPLLIQGIPQADRPQWEQCRLRTFATASMFSNNSLRLTDIIKFPWDEEDEQRDLPKEITQSEIDNLKQTAKLFEKKWQPTTKQD